MGAHISCVGGPNTGCAMVIADATSAPERWRLPAEAIDIMIEHPFHDVIDGDQFLKTGRKTRMRCEEPLKAKKVYFLVPTHMEEGEGRVREEADLVPKMKGLKKLMGRTGIKKVLPVKESTGPNEA